ncbi:hypothetical protein PsalSR1_04921 (plasmid) [Piscirickettsia salmonis]|uniref:hypothetical protein n=1 Tax=Piscirickettsia salmonis TaxID=1238 RepID=UPI0012D98E90|nr:hypothetical protein [Piscirickettsia salmonis]QGP57432.1 hypothetical protein PsalSR1_04921 [Piscirickettsia salmonis]
MPVLDTKATKRRLKCWGDYVQTSQESIGWPESIFKTIQEYGGFRVTGNKRGCVPLLPNNEYILEIDNLVKDLFLSSAEDDKAMGQILYLEYCVSGTAAAKQFQHRVPSARYQRYLQVGVAYVKGCLNQSICSALRKTI